jgi:hypothetical protein
MPLPTPAPADGAESATRARSFDLAASKIYDFRLTFFAGCKEPEKGETCHGPAQLVVAKKDRSTSQTIAFEEAIVVSDANGMPLVNASALYDDQGSIVVGDFNFDGREDFAMLTGQSGPYGGPTFTVFLASPSGPFVHSTPLSKLTDENLGLFKVDEKKKRLVTLAKDGCCLHVTQELAVVDNKPVLMDRVTEDGTSGDKLVVTHERRVGGKLLKSVERRPLPK